MKTVLNTNVPLTAETIEYLRSAGRSVSAGVRKLARELEGVAPQSERRKIRIRLDEQTLSTLRAYSPQLSDGIEEAVRRHKQRQG